MVRIFFNIYKNTGSLLGDYDEDEAWAIYSEIEEPNEDDEHNFNYGQFRHLGVKNTKELAKSLENIKNVATVMDGSFGLQVLRLTSYH